MLSRKKVFFIMKLIGTLFLAALFAIIYFQSLKEQESHPRPFPSIIAQNQRNDLAVDLPFKEQLKNKVVYINFWALWCPPCLTEIPQLNHLYKEMGQDNFRVLLLNVDNPEDQRKAQQFVKNYAPALLSSPKNNSKIQTQLQADRLPYHIFLDKQGRIALEHYGNLEQNWADFKQQVLLLLKEDSPSQ